MNDEFARVRQRIVAALGANAFGQGVSIVIQLASLPIFLSVWDNTRYGSWLMLSAIPAYLSMADVGMVATAGNRMTMAMGRGDRDQAAHIFQSALGFMLLTCLGVAAASMGFALADPFHMLADAGQREALAMLMLGVVCGLFGGVTEAIYRASERYALGTMLANLTRLLEWAGAMVGLLLWGTMPAVAAAMLAVRVSCMVGMMVHSQVGDHPFRWQLQDARRDDIVAMLRPAVSFMAFPLANALTFQGSTIVVGHWLGASAIAVFNTYRTLARVAVQVTGVFGHALWTEFSRLYGQGGGAATSPLFRRAALTGAALSVMLSILLFAVSPWLLAWWTHDRIDVMPWLLGCLLAYAAVGGSWHVPRVLLLSSNRHIGLAQWSLIAALVCLLGACVGAQLLGLQGVALAMLLSEAGLALVCVRQALAFTRTPLPSRSAYAS